MKLWNNYGSDIRSILIINLLRLDEISLTGIND